MLNFCSIVVAILKMVTGRNFSKSGINYDVLNWFPTLKIDRWVDNDVLNWFPTLNNFYRTPFWKWPPQYLSTHISKCDDIGQCWIFVILWRPFWKWRSVEIFQCRDIIIYPHINFLWDPLHIWVDYDVPNLFPTLKNFYRSPFSKWSTQYRTNSTLSDFNAIQTYARYATWRHQIITRLATDNRFKK
jgi:uncharacterized protein Usg